MPLATIVRGQMSVVLRFKILNSSLSTGAGLTGLTHASSGLRIGTIADNEATATAYTTAGSTIETITTLGTYAAPTATKCRFKEVDATNHPGWYELHLADARFAVSNAKSLGVTISGPTNCAETDFLVALVADDPQVAKWDGDWNTIANAPAPFNGDWTTLTNVPGIFDGDWNNLTNAPNFGDGSVQVTFVNTDIALESSVQSAISAVAALPQTTWDGDWNSIANMPPLSQWDGDWNNVSNQPALPAVDVSGYVTFNNDLSSLALEATLATVATYIDTEVAAIKAKTDNLPASFPTNFSALGINASGHVSRVTLTDTVTTLTGHTAQTGDAYAVVNSGTFGNAAIKTETTAIKTKTDNLPASPAAVGSAMTLADGAITAAKIASAALDDKGNWLKPTTSGRTLDVSAAGNAGIDWANVENPTTTVGLTGTTVNMTGIATATDVTDAVAAIEAHGDASWPTADLTGIAQESTSAAIQAKTDTIPASPAEVGSAMTLTSDERNAIADALLVRDFATLAATAPEVSLAFLRYVLAKSYRSGGNLIVKRPNGTTWATIPITTDELLEPIASIGG